RRPPSLPRAKARPPTRLSLASLTAAGGRLWHTPRTQPPTHPRMLRRHRGRPLARAPRVGPRAAPAAGWVPPHDRRSRMKGSILVTGGAGFVGSNLTRDLLRDGHHVTVFDALRRRGAKHNLAWLREQSNGRLTFVRGDVRDFQAVRAAAADAGVIYHLAGQVAVTSSVEDPRAD